MSNIERNIAKLICEDEVGNAVLINRNRAITVRHCIEPYLNNNDVDIYLYCYDGKDYVKNRAFVLDYSRDGDGFAILELERELKLENAIILSYYAQPFEECATLGFNKNHNEKPSWRKLTSNSSSDIKLENLICDMAFVDSSKEFSVEGLSGSPILLKAESNQIIGLVSQQHVEKNHEFEISGISVSSQEAFLKSNNIQFSLPEDEVETVIPEVSKSVVVKDDKYDYSWLQLSDLQLFDDFEVSKILEEFSEVKKEYNIKFILVTADLHYYGTAYNKALDLLNGLISLFGLSKKNVYIVPGNNDVNDFHLKKYMISSVSTNTESEATYYMECYNELLQGFDDYNSFIKDFYGKDSIYDNAAEVTLKEWSCDDNPSLGINLIHLNTALICNGNDAGKNIFNIEMLQQLSGGNSEYPSIVIAHHPVSLLFESHENYLSRFVTNRNISAYLCGQINLHKLENIRTNIGPDSSIPCIACSKCSKDAHNQNSDLGYIVYSKIHNSNSVEVLPYTWNRTEMKFRYSSELESKTGKYVFSFLKRNNIDSSEELQIYENDSKSVWLIDAECAVGEQTRFKKYTKTRIVNEFLNDDPQFWGLSAVKGIGKTFLLQVKRANMPSDTICIPIGVKPTEYNHWGTDVLHLYNLRGSETMLLDYEQNIMLWKYCILVYVINQIINRDADPQAKDAVQTIKNQLLKLEITIQTKEWCIDKTQENLSDIMENVLQNKTWYIIIKDDYITLSKRLKYYIAQWLKIKKKSRVALFIDKVDEAYTASLNQLDYKNKAMKYLGVSLLNASFEIKQFFSGTIQVFFVIREEVKREIGNKLGEATSKISNICKPLYYKKEEQKRIFYDCISYQSPELLFDSNYLKSSEYEKAFVGVNELCHPYIQGLKESVFDCIYRHSFDRSRDIQEYGRALTKKIHEIKAIEDDWKRGEKVKTIIEKQAAILTIGTQGEGDENNVSYYDEKIYQLPEFWQDKEVFRQLMKLFDKNLLFGKEARKICQEFNTKDSCDGKCAECNAQHFPFEILYKTGLLGRIDGHLSGYTDTYSLNFIHSKNVGNIADKAISIDGILDDSAYLLHPAYTKAIEAIKREGIRHFGGFLIGKDLTVEKELFAKIYSEYLNSEEKYNKTYFFQKKGFLDSF